MDTSPHKSDFVEVNGIRLHYLDWGGQGPVLVFLTGMGNSAHIYDQFAPRFTDKFRVVALTRRGHGESDYPDTGYDPDTLTEDLRQFMDSLGVNQAILVGHSLAHIELRRFSVLYPERVLKLVFLDAAYDYTKFRAAQEQDPLKDVQPPQEDFFTAEDYFAYLKKIHPALAEVWSDLWAEEPRHSITKDSNGKIITKMTDKIGQALMDSGSSYVPEDSKIKAPILSIYAMWVDQPFTDYLTEAQKALALEFWNTARPLAQQQGIEQFRRAVPLAKIVIIPKGHHYCFIKHEALVFEEMMKFLLE
jgi:non-heme chloroperoxidase